MSVSIKDAGGWNTYNTFQGKLNLIPNDSCRDCPYKTRFSNHPKCSVAQYVGNIHSDDVNSMSEPLFQSNLETFVPSTGHIPFGCPVFEDI